MSLKEDADLLNHILECEQTAVGVYERLLDTSAQYPQIWALNAIKDDHKQACGLLRQQIQALGGEPSNNASSVVYRGVERSLQLRIFEDLEALQNLRDCEAQELEECRRALRRESQYGPARTTMTGQMIPILEQHVEFLDMYLAKQIPTESTYMR